MTQQFFTKQAKDTACRVKTNRAWVEVVATTQAVVHVKTGLDASRLYRLTDDVTIPGGNGDLIKVETQPGVFLTVSGTGDFTFNLLG